VKPIFCFSVEIHEQAHTERWCLANLNIIDGALHVSGDMDGEQRKTIYAAGHWLIIRFWDGCCDDADS
jgi:hypothetical protein